MLITDLPADIYDHISLFLPDRDLARFLCASRQITVSTYLYRDRQRAYWKRCGKFSLAEKGDLQGLQYLHSIGAVFREVHVGRAAASGHLAVVQFFHTVCAVELSHTPFTFYAMDWAAENDQMAVMQYLHTIGAPYTDNGMELASYNGHLAIVQFLHSIGAACTLRAINMAAWNGHSAVVQFLKENQRN